MASGALDAVQTIGNPHTHHRLTFIPDIHHMSLLHCCMNPAGKLNDSAFTKALGGWKAFLAILSFACIALAGSCNAALKQDSLLCPVKNNLMIY